MVGVDRLFIIPPTLPYSGDVVSEAAAAAKDAGVKHVLLLSASSSEMDPNHKYAPMKGSFHYLEKKVIFTFDFYSMQYNLYIFPEQIFAQTCTFVEPLTLIHGL